MGIPDLLRNLYAGQEATVRTGHGKIDWSQTGKGVSQGCILSPCLFNLDTEYFMRNAGLDEAQAGIKILETKKIVCHCFHCFSIYLPLSYRARRHDPSFLNVEL